MERLFGQPHPPSQRGSVEAALAQAHKEAVQKREAKQAAKLQTKREAATELEAMFSPDEQAVLREMDELDAELFQLEASMEQMGIDWRGVQVSEVALGLLLKSGWLEPAAKLQAAKLQAKREAAAELEAMFSPDEQAVLREMTEDEVRASLDEVELFQPSLDEVELFQLEAWRPAPSTTYPIDLRGVQVSEVALGLLLKSGWLDLEPPASLGLKAEKQSAHRGKVCSVAFSPDGATIVSGSSDSMIKVWDAGVRRHWYRLNPQPKTDRFPACGSFPGAQGREAERAQRHSVLCGHLPRRRDPRLGLRRQDDQSLGCR